MRKVGKISEKDNGRYIRVNFPSGLINGVERKIHPDLLWRLVRWVYSPLDDMFWR